MRTVIRAAIIGLAAICLASCGSGGTRIRASFYSNALGRAMEYQLLLPDAQRESRVVYLLHGHGGDASAWFDRTAVEDIALELNMAVVTPDGGNSWYVNSATGPWEDYIVTDLLEEVERRWPVAKTRAGRAIAGLSMGGYGALKIAFSHPEKFAFAGSTGGALDITRPANIFDPSGGAEELVNIFGQPGSAIRHDNDVYRLAASSDAATLPYLYVDCGMDDPWFGINQEFVSVLKSRQLAHEFHGVPGHHIWPYWNRRARVILEQASARLK